MLDILYEKFGGHVNKKGFKVLEKHVRLIQGDGVNMESIKEILNLLETIGFSADCRRCPVGARALFFQCAAKKSRPW